MADSSKRPSLRGVLLAPDASGADAYTPVSARRVLALLSSLRPGRSWGSRAQTLYLSALSIAVIVGLFWGLSKRLGTLLVEVAGFYHFAWGAPAIVLVFFVAFRYSTVQGFVSFTEPDCVLLLPAPLRRRDLVLPRLGTAGILVGVVGALAGTLVAVVSHGAGQSGGRVGKAALAGFALGVLVVAGSWHVQRLRWATAWVLRLTLPALGLAVLLGFAQGAQSWARVAGLWSGPWGWGILAVGGGGTGGTAHAAAYGTAALGLLCALALAGGISLFRTAGRCSIEEFRSRARTRSQVVASLHALDWRSVGQASKGSKAQTWQARVRIRMPRRQMLIVPWHSAVALLRSPVRLGWGIMLAGAGMVLLAHQPTGQGTLWAGAVALYLAASSLLEPLRLEVDSPATARLFLPWRFDVVLWLHCLLPAAIVVIAGVLAVAGATALGYVTAGAFGAMTLIVIPLSLAVVLAAAFSARRGGRVSVNLIEVASLDTTGFSFVYVLLRLAIWAILALVATVLAVFVAGRAHFAVGVPLLEVFGGLVVLAVALQRGLVAMPQAAE
jgi:hypothetical protein